MVKLLVLGLDGATFDVLEPMFAEDMLPNLQKIVSGGATGRLESIIPAVTGPAWTSLATGKNPGKTGAFDFTIRDRKGDFEMRSIGSANIRRARAYWDYLSDRGATVGILNYPALYPPYPINGFMVSGLPRSPEEDITYPRELKPVLLDSCGGYKIHVPWQDPIYLDNPSLFIKDELELLAINEKAIKLLLKQSPDVFTVVISATDFAQHFMWRYIDETHPLYQEEEAQKYKPGFIQIWQRVDQILGSVLEIIPGSANIFVVSDHGFGPLRGHFYTNAWLEKEGYLYRCNKSRLALQAFAGKVLGKVNRLSPSLQANILKRTEKYVAPFTYAIDMKRSLAYADVHSLGPGAICMNTSEESPIKSKEDYEVARTKIIEGLKHICNSLNLKASVYCSADIYSGEYAKFAPDILFEIDELACQVHYVFNKEVYSQVLYDPSQSGVHRMDGILIAYGADIKEGAKVEGTKIYDIAPTILHMFGLPVPKDIDGCVLKEIFREDSGFSKRPVDYQEEDEGERVRKRIKGLKDLGKL